MQDAGESIKRFKTFKVQGSRFEQTSEVLKISGVLNLQTREEMFNNQFSMFNFQFSIVNPTF